MSGRQHVSDVRDWIGREQQLTDEINVAPMLALSATLDRDDPLPQPGDPLPAFWHWLYFLPRARTDALAADGHPPLGGFMPPVGLPRRMWAGSRLSIMDAPRVGDRVQRISRVENVTEKEGSSGKLAFVTVQHDIHTPRGLAIREMQDLVYREPAATGQAGAIAKASDGEARASMFSRVITPNPVLLFRYSALTFNSHRIHYDRRHAMDVEGYPGLVVHGPLVATLLLDLLRREHPESEVREFSFKARRPLFDIAPFSVHGRADRANQFTLWTLYPDGHVAVEASATIASTP
jgi:3-methylfumaryl-CoA hydratase